MTKATKPTVSYEGKLYGFDATARGGGQWRMIGTTGGYGKFLKKEVQDQWGKPILGETLASMPETALAPPKTNTTISDKASKKMKRSAKLGSDDERNKLISAFLGQDVADLVSVFFDKKENTKNKLLDASKTIGSGKSLKIEDVEKAELAAQTKTNDLQTETNKLLEKNNSMLADLIKFFKSQAAKADIAGDIKQVNSAESMPLERLGGAQDDATEDSVSGGGPGLLDILNPFSSRNKARGRLLKRGVGRFFSRAAGAGKAIIGGIGAAGAGIASSIGSFSVPNMSTMDPMSAPKAPTSTPSAGAPSAGAAAGEAAGAAKVPGKLTSAAKTGLKYGSKVLKGLGPIAAILGIGATIYELTELKQQLDGAVASGQMTEAEADKTFKKAAIKSLGSSFGAVGGGIAGAAIGSMILPLVGTAIGGVAGGIAGGFGGEWLAEKLYDFLDSGKEVDPEKLKKEMENPDKSKDLKGAPSSMPSMPSFDGGVPMSDIGTPTPTPTVSAITPTPTVSSAEMMVPELRQTGKVALNSSDQLNEATRAYAMPVGAPVVNNIVNNMGGGGSTVSVQGPTSSARNDDSAYRRAQDRLYMPA